MNLVIYNPTEIRYHALINNSAWSTLYQNEVFQRLEKGQHIARFVKKVRENGKIDLCLQKPDSENVDDVMGRIIAKPKTKGGFTFVTDTNLLKPSTAVRGKYENMQKSGERSL